MRAVSLICQAEHPILVSQSHNLPKIGADPVVGGIVHQHGFCLRILPDGPLYLLHLHSQRDPQTHIALWVYINRNRSAEDQRPHHAPVNISGQDNLIASLYHREDHALHGRCGSPHHQKGVSGAEGFGRQALCLGDHGNRMAEVIQRLHGVYINPHTLFSQKPGQFRISSSRHVKRDHSHTLKTLERLENRGIFLRECFHGRFLLSCGAAPHQ